MDGSDERVVPGNALTVSPNLPYRGLDRFGVSFLNKFEASQLPSPVLRNITIVDTPGEVVLWLVTGLKPLVVLVLLWSWWLWSLCC